ncbi:MAG: hypothetical protein HY074_10045 [Deltaproteobacteria bacterium]|nr:hypothetical protein [Deltaproteobacteria bacterium]
MILKVIKNFSRFTTQEPGVTLCPFVPRSFNHISNKRQGGQATVEYVLLIGVAALIGVGFMSAFTPIIQQGILTFNVTLETELVSGGFTEAAQNWEN